jgi:HNH endonuclease
MKRKKRKQQQQESIVVLVILGLVLLGTLALANLTVFLWCAGILVGLLTLYFTISISKHATASEQPEVARDSRYISPQLRQAVWTRCGGMCVQCQSRSLIEYDHILPLSKGGATSYENLQILCRTCNRHKSDHI